MNDLYHDLEYWYNNGWRKDTISSTPFIFKRFGIFLIRIYTDADMTGIVHIYIQTDEFTQEIRQDPFGLRMNYDIPLHKQIFMVEAKFSGILRDSLKDGM